MYPLYLTFLKGINSFIIYKIFHKDIHIFYRRVNIFRFLNLFLYVTKIKKQTIYNYVVTSFFKFVFVPNSTYQIYKVKGLYMRDSTT